MTTTLIILVVTAVFFVWGKIRSDIVALSSLLALVLTGILTPEEALSGFSNSVVIMIAALFIVGGAIFQTGIAGTLLTFMLLFSSHPAVGSNWQVWILNPIALVGIPLIIKAAIRRRKTHWYAFQFAVLALFVLFSPWIPQDFAKITVPLALCLLTRPISYHNILRRKKKK